MSPMHSNITSGGAPPIANLARQIPSSAASNPNEPVCAWRNVKSWALSVAKSVPDNLLKSIASVKTAIHDGLFFRSESYHPEAGGNLAPLPEEKSDLLKKPSDAKESHGNIDALKAVAANYINNIVDPYIKKFESNVKTLKLLRYLNIANSAPKATEVLSAARKFFGDSLPKLIQKGESVINILNRNIISTVIYTASKYFFSEKNSMKMSRWTSGLVFKTLKFFNVLPIHVFSKNISDFILKKISKLSLGNLFSYAKNNFQKEDIANQAFYEEYAPSEQELIEAYNHEVNVEPYHWLGSVRDWSKNWWHGQTSTRTSTTEEKKRPELQEIEGKFAKKDAPSQENISESPPVTPEKLYKALDALDEAIADSRSLREPQDSLNVDTAQISETAPMTPEKLSKALDDLDKAIADSRSLREPQGSLNVDTAQISETAPMTPEKLSKALDDLDEAIADSRSLREPQDSLNVDTAQISETAPMTPEKLSKALDDLDKAIADSQRLREPQGSLNVDTAQISETAPMTPEKLSKALDDLDKAIADSQRLREPQGPLNVDTAQISETAPVTPEKLSKALDDLDKAIADSQRLLEPQGPLNVDTAQISETAPVTPEKLSKALDDLDKAIADSQRLLEPQGPLNVDTAQISETAPVTPEKLSKALDDLDKAIADSQRLLEPQGPLNVDTANHQIDKVLEESKNQFYGHTATTTIALENIKRFELRAREEEFAESATPSQSNSFETLPRTLEEHDKALHKLEKSIAAKRRSLEAQGALEIDEAPRSLLSGFFNWCRGPASTKTSTPEGKKDLRN